MLPQKAGNYTLSDDSAQKLERFYDRFCEGENRERYGLSHIVFACHAAFPMVLSPDLINVLWLNFKTYSSGDASTTVDRIVISDLLLSSIVRPVAARQYEIIPDIRNYLLSLLKDDRWFSLYGIGPFGDKRLNELADFLKQYLSHKRSLQENTVGSFHQLNEWAVLAYQQPDVLARQMANALQQTFSGDPKQNNDHDQLRISLLANRVGKQLDSGLHDKEADMRSFQNFQLYSSATKADLYGHHDMSVQLLMKLDKTFIGTGNATTSQIALPINNRAGERLERAKNNVQRVFSVLLSGQKQAGKQSRPATTKWDDFLSALGSTKGFIRKDITQPGGDVTKESIKLLLIYLFNQINNEDSCLIYFSGRAYFSDGKSGIETKDKGLAIDEFVEMIKDSRGIKTAQIVLLVDLNEPIARHNLLPGDVVIYTSGYNDFSSRPLNPRKSVLSSATSIEDSIFELLKSMTYKITYRDIERYIHFKQIFERSEEEPLPVIIANRDALNRYFLRYDRPMTDNKYVIAYNNVEQSWQMLDEDFLLVVVNRAAAVFNYDGIEALPDTGGEFFARQRIVKFGGSTKGMAKDLLYKALPEREDLSCVIYTPALDERVHNDVYQILFDKFSRWDRLHNDLREAIDSETLTISSQPADEKRCTISYERRPGYNNSSTISYRCENVAIEQLVTTIKRMVRYVYLQELDLPKAPYDLYDKFNTDISYQVHLESANGSEYTRLSSITHEALRVTPEGELTLAQFFLHIKNNESFPIYYSVYVLGAGCSIDLLSEPDEGSILPGAEKVLSVSNPMLLKKMANELEHTVLKILFSREEMQYDFSNIENPGSAL